MFEELSFMGLDWSKLEVKQCFPENIISKIFETSSSFHREYLTMGKF